jgi:hypothetical protein
MSNWLPIETLRDEHVPVLMRLPDGSVTVGDVDVVGIVTTERKYRDLINNIDVFSLPYNYGYEEINPTHWQPFPSGSLERGVVMELDQKLDVERGEAYLRLLRERKENIEGLIREAKPASMLVQAAIRELSGVNAAISWLLQQTSLFSAAEQIWRTL